VSVEVKRGVQPLMVALLLVAGFLGGFAADRAGDWLTSEVSCDQRDLAEHVMRELEAHYSPPLARLELTGMCDDDNPFWGVTGRVAGSASDAGALLRDLGCTPITSGPIYEDLDRVAASRFRCDLPGVERPLGIAVRAHGLTRPRPGPGISMTIIPL
jgi:hypothetical protein